MSNLNNDSPFDDNEKKCAEFVEQIPIIPPKQAFKLLEKKEYRGQVQGRRSLCLSAYRHIRRLKRIYLEKVPRENLPSKSNVLMIGPTGCGKTFLVELLFKHILKLPTAIVDMTGFSETGYVGDDTKTVLTRLIIAAEGDPRVASLGILCLDEFDKLASNQNYSQGMGKDVSGYGVQRELLKMLEASHLDVPGDFDSSMYSSKETIYTGDIVFIACGAFPFFKMTAFSRNTRPHLGFGATNNNREAPQDIAYSINDEEVADIGNFQQYGFIPELIARFNQIVPMEPLDKKTLKAILIDNIVRKFQNEFLSEGIELEIEEPVLDALTQRGLERQTGARGLGSLLTQSLENLAFEHFCGGPGKVVLKLQGSEIAPLWEPNAKRKKIIQA